MKRNNAEPIGKLIQQFLRQGHRRHFVQNRH